MFLTRERDKNVPLEERTAIANNRKAVANRYGPALYRERLLTIYDRVSHRPVRHRLDKRVLLDAFFDLERFPLLKWGVYDG